MAARRRPRPSRRGPGPVLLLLLAAAGAPGLARGQVSPATAPAAGEADASAGSAPDLPGSRAAALDPAPQCGLVNVFAPRCNFVAINAKSLKITMINAKVTVISPPRRDLDAPATGYDVPFGSNSLRRLLHATFPTPVGNSNVYLSPPACTVSVTAGRRTLSGTADLYKVREDSVRAHPRPGRPDFPARGGKYLVKLQRGRGHDDMSDWPTGPCQMIIATPCSPCLAGEAKFGAGCVDAIATADVCPVNEAAFGGEAGCAAAVPTADACPGSSCITAFDSTFDSDGTCVAACPDVAPFADGDTCVESCTGLRPFVDGGSCVAACSEGEAPTSGNVCAPPCSYTDATCAAGATCPGGTLVSAACADRSAFDESPCACTALQELAALSAANLATEAPWNDLANAAYCTVADGQYYSVSVHRGLQFPSRAGAPSD